MTDADARREGSASLEAYRERMARVHGGSFEWDDSEPFALLVVGFVPVAVAAVLADPGVCAGLVHGLLVGGLCTLLVWALLAGWMTRFPPAYVAPGFGISVVLLGAFGLLVGVESVVGGLAVGLVRR